MELKASGEDLRLLAVDLGKVPARVVPAVVPVVKKAGHNIMTDWRQAWSGHPHIPALPRAVSYDMRYGVGTVGVEVGPDKGRAQGALGNVIEFGTENNAPIPGGLPALDRETPNFERELGVVLERELGGR